MSAQYIDDGLLFGTRRGPRAARPFTNKKKEYEEMRRQANVAVLEIRIKSLVLWLGFWVGFFWGGTPERLREPHPKQVLGVLGTPSLTMS